MRITTTENRNHPVQLRFAPVVEPVNLDAKPRIRIDKDAPSEKRLLNVEVPVEPSHKRVTQPS